jgi:hypothetical protein
MRAMLLAIALAVVPCAAAAAQDMERVVVTASPIDQDDLRSAPAIYRRIPADFVLVSVSYQSATRDPGERKKELETMFIRLKEKAAKTDGYELSGGTIGESTADIDTVLFSDIHQTDYNGTGRFTLTLSVDTRAGEPFDRLMKRAEDFVMTIKTAGRAEAYLGDDQFIGARDVTKHRADLVADIAAEVRSLQALLAPAKVTLTGLENRIITQPSGPLELEMFIPYTLTVESGAGE